MTGQECPDCGTVLDPGGSCFICPAAQIPAAYDPGPVPEYEAGAGESRTSRQLRETEKLREFRAEHRIGPAPLPAPAGAAVLDEVCATLTRYVVFPSAEAGWAVTLFAAATWAMPYLEFAARLVIKSPVKRCGKSRLLDVLGLLVQHPLMTSDISAAALVRSVPDADDAVTIMLDEADTTFGKALKGDEKAEHLRGILNAGFGRDRPYKRWDITTRSVEDCPTFAMAVLAGIGDMPDTIEDRAVIITMRRKAPGEAVAKFRLRRDKAKVYRVTERLWEWVFRGVAGAVADAEPDMPPGLNDRAEDVWEAMVAIADAAGSHWPSRARQAALSLTADDDTDTSLGARLLADLRDVFGDADALHTETIRDALHKISEAPWGDYFGRPVTARDMAKLLRPYGVASADVKIGGINRKGYRREHLHDAWTRYLPPAQGGTATSATSATAQVNDHDQVAGSGWDPLPATSALPLTSEVAQVAEVADPPPVCAVCGGPLDPALIEAGFTTHGEDEAAEPANLREDTHEEQERLYPQTLRIGSRHDERDKFLPTRAEWADPEAARLQIVRTCYSHERVPSGAEHYLSPAELDEMSTLYRELCQSVRPVITAEIKRLRGLLPSQHPGRTREHVAWYLALGEDDQAVADRLSLLEDARRDLGRVLRDGGPDPRYDQLAHDYIAEFVPDQDKLRRRTELLEKLEAAREAAAQAAEDAAVAAEQASRLTDDGWAAALRHRESMEEYFTQGPLR
jgi:hypothetical protein